MSCSFFPRDRHAIEQCCAQHDHDYSEAGTVKRWQSDKALYNCVAQYSRWKAVVIFVGVRLFGWIFWRKKHG